ncbi:putative bifunctional diguanylate cyclase/phosphodiesterase [Noviherbaspirillum sedimenti]|uniref:EAL domain-containing protein n=1 Tax=Noviherbaspirillum sedimenti TaxID=2320865 RepID=A0A3A3GAT4_9BURK|nr:EAL domain-containing protein [Noviherbaspirillum sedimenti]RJG03879.1 EAL domain-containing protein [Noviherbaspirillum sedimenti]
MSNLVLIVSDRAEEAEALRNVLPQAIDGPFDIEWVRTLARAMQRLTGDGIDIVLMDFFLPDSKGMRTFDQLFEAAAPVPIMTLVTEGEMDLAQEAVQRGAQGYILKGHFRNALLPQALRNTIHRKQVEDALFIEKERAAVTLDSIVDGVISTDSEGRITYLNNTAERMTGWAKAEAIGHPVAEVFPLVDNINRKSFNDPVVQVIQEMRPLALRADALLVRRNGQEAAIEDSVAPIYDRRGKIRGAVIVFRDIGPAQALMVQKMTYQAHHDSLTDLPNRILLIDRLEHAIALAKRNGTTLAVLFLDLDNFKNINDSHGHATGDQLLASVAQRLLNCIRASDTVSRLGGDEFVILVTEERHAEAAAHTAEKIIASLAQPHRIQQYAFHITASIGISTFPADGEEADTLIRNADTAMYYAKKKGRNNYQFFNAAMNRRAVERQFIEVGLRRALEAQEFSLYYQPKVNLKTGKITGVEALLRWHHPERGLMLPGDFVSIAEDCGLIVPISRWVLREACRQTKLWLEAGFKPISTAVNISALAFHNQNFLQDLRDILQETALDPACLELELTESVLMPDSQFSNEILQTLKSIGVKLAIDDFGTGYSSLSYLQEFPIDVLKIDQSFVRGIPELARNRIIVTAVTGMGISLKYRVIAEGVETRKQFSFLTSLECDEGQGNYFSPPLAADRCTRLLKTGIAENLLH